MKEVGGKGHGQGTRASGHAGEPALQVVCLGSGGGPSEDNVTGFLVRSTATKWTKNSVLAVDAGSHLAAITRILENDFPLISASKGITTPPVQRNNSSYNNSRDQDPPSPGTTQVSSAEEDSNSSTPLSEDTPEIITTLETGAFAGLPFPHASARANALHVVREHVSTYLITHPHLDHVSGFVINTAAFHNTSRPKRLAALPFTVNAIKTHFFNNVVWPNLTDEDGGVGLVTFQRLAEGGNIALGEGGGRGYIEVCDGLGVKGFKVSHGHCMRGPGHIHRGSTTNLPETAANVDGREGRASSFSLAAQSAPGTPPFTGNPLLEPGRTASISGGAGGGGNVDQCVIDSTAYFIRTESTHHTPCKEVLIFGDVEPDIISLSPRTALVWAEAAPKVAAGILTGIFIECSYTNSQCDSLLYGHLSPRHLLGELENLAGMVKEARRVHEKEKEETRTGRNKRKRTSYDGGLLGSGIDPNVVPDAARKRKRSQQLDDGVITDYTQSPTSGPSGGDVYTPAHPSPLDVSHLSADLEAPLRGLKVVIIHVKDTFADGPLIGDSILQELQDGERALDEQGRGLGCVFEISESGASYWF